ncbi:4-hydroxyphenylpyruvate dioxygenase [Streptomyces shenzhenensis]|uniref:4-hydroxyphenylpyruvate dioxygenase n=1 Tax=Streptomyces shenzhenensis TaxID=943815 RepID=UPI0015F1006F|nr:4-hydroxyphenylpyruvate dioxygenase [Streptomyces shenzhenensis]
MGVRDIEYVELYASESKSALDYFVESLGFVAVAESEEPGRQSVLLAQGRVRILLTTGPDTREFLDTHGDGIADIALSCDDVAATYEAAMAAGARSAAGPGEAPVVSGFGSVRHTLLPVPDASGTGLPTGRTWTELAPAGPPAGRIAALDHVAVCLEAGTLADYTDYYTTAFGLPTYSAEYVAFGDQAMESVVVRSPSGGATFTLIEPDKKKQAGQIDMFLDRNNGPGVQHLAFLVDDIVPAVHEFRERGVTFLSTPGAYYDLLAERFADLREEIQVLREAHVLADRDEWGYLLQLFTRSPYEHNTLFYELIQRRGSRGFGSANIRALYEAVERDRLVGE